MRIVNDTNGFPPVDDHAFCMRCRRKLVNPKWRARGYGPTCLEIVLYERVMSESGKTADVKRQRKIARGDFRLAERLQKTIHEGGAE